MVFIVMLFSLLYKIEKSKTIINLELVKKLQLFLLVKELQLSTRISFITFTFNNQQAFILSTSYVITVRSK